MAKILVADDDITSRKLIAKAIEGMGHSCVGASDGKRAMDILQDNADIALLVTDIMMPEMDGRVLVQAIRGNSALKDLPIVLISGVISLKEINGLLNLGVSRFLPKPVVIEELKGYISQLVKE